jgi:hypothetical protein
MTDPVILDFKGLGHPSELCGFYHGAGGVISAVVSDELSFVDAMVNNTINCILFAEDVVMRAETYRIGVRIRQASLWLATNRRATRQGMVLA